MYDVRTQIALCFKIQFFLCQLKIESGWIDWLITSEIYQENIVQKPAQSSNQFNGMHEDPKSHWARVQNYGPSLILR